MNPRSPDVIDRFVAQRVREARREAGMSQGELADDIGITHQQMQKYEAGRNRISAGRLAAIAERCGRDIAWFFPPPQHLKIAA